jgi:hypothetical protein
VCRWTIPPPPARLPAVAHFVDMLVKWFMLFVSSPDQWQWLLGCLSRISWNCRSCFRVLDASREKFRVKRFKIASSFSVGESQGCRNPGSNLAGYLWELRRNKILVGLLAGAYKVFLEIILRVLIFLRYWKLGDEKDYHAYCQPLCKCTSHGNQVWN